MAVLDTLVSLVEELDPHWRLVHRMEYYGPRSRKRRCWIGLWRLKRADGSTMQLVRAEMTGAPFLCLLVGK